MCDCCASTSAPITHPTPLQIANAARRGYVHTEGDSLCVICADCTMTHECVGCHDVCINIKIVTRSSVTAWMSKHHPGGKYVYRPADGVCHDCWESTKYICVACKRNKGFPSNLAYNVGVVQVQVGEAVCRGCRETYRPLRRFVGYNVGKCPKQTEISIDKPDTGCFWDSLDMSVFGQARIDIEL